jgi:hypothetical protein
MRTAAQLRAQALGRHAQAQQAQGIAEIGAQVGRRRARFRRHDQRGHALEELGRPACEARDVAVIAEAGAQELADIRWITGLGQDLGPEPFADLGEETALAGHAGLGDE